MRREGRDTSLTAAEVAYRLGYEDASNFGKARHRWFGCSPGVFTEAGPRTGAAGAFADPSFPPPEDSVYDSRRHSWVQLPPGTIPFDEDPPD